MPNPLLANDSATPLTAALPPRRIAGMPPAWAGNVRGDCLGGLLAAVISVPLSIGFGLLAFAPLGEAYLGAGILAGLYGAIFLGLVAIASGASGVTIYAPRSLVAFMIGSVALHTLAASDAAAAHAGDPWFIGAALLFTLALAGLVQVAFGLAGFGSLMKFIPSPVMAGFQNAAAILILYSQAHILLGLPKRVPLAALPEALPAALPLTLGVGVATALVIWKGRRWVPKVPPALTGLAAGTLLYYLLKLAGLGQHLGPVIGATPVELPDGTTFARIVAATAHPAFAELLPSLVAAAVSVAVVASLDVLICARIVEGLSGRRTDGNRELRRVGLANLVTPLLGGIAGAISLSSTTANHRGGARTSLSVLVHSLAILVTAVLLPPVLGALPLVVIAGLLVMTALQLFDPWTLQLARKMVNGEAVDWRRIAIDLAVIALVTVMAVVGDIVTAVLVGIGIAVAFFVLRMSRSVIRREYTCEGVHSRRTRGVGDMALLAREGGRILVLELEGPLFFGSAELLTDRIDGAIREGAQYVLLDFRRVNEVDSTGARFLVQSEDRMRQAGRLLLLAGAEEKPPLAASLRDAGVLAAVTRDRMFPDIDHALEWAEDELIALAEGEARSGGEFPLERMDIVKGLDEEALRVFRALLERRTYRAGETIVREGDDGDELFILAKGSASVHLRQPARARAERLITFSPGTVFGEFALLDRETRSATVEADEDSVCYLMKRALFEALSAEHGAIAVKLLTNLGRELSLRLRRANRMLTQLS